MPRSLSIPLTDQQLRQSIYATILMMLLLPPFLGGTIMGLVGFYPLPEFYLVFISYSGLYVLAVLLIGLSLVPRAYRFIIQLSQLEADLAAAVAQRVFSRLPWYLVIVVTLYSIGGALSADYSLEALGFANYSRQDHLYHQFGLIPVVLITVFPIFFFFIDRLGRYLGPRGISITAIPLWVKLLMLGIVTPLLIDSLLIGYYYNRTQYFQLETLALWFSLLLLAVGGTWLAWRSLQQSLAPLEMFISASSGSIHERASSNLKPLSLDELGVLTARSAKLLTTHQQLADDLQGTQLLADSVIDNAGALVLVLDPDGRIVRFNHACEKVSGYKFAEIQGKFPWDTVLPAEEADTIRKNAFDILTNNPKAMSGQFSNYWVHKDGSRTLIEWSNTVLCDNTDNLKFIVSIGIDITETNKIQQQLQQQATIIDQIHDSVVSTDLDGIITSWNKGAEQILGYTASEMLGHSIAEVYPADQQQVLMDNVITPLKANGSHVADVIMQRKNGERFNGHISLSLKYNEEQQAIGMIGYTMDVSEQVRAEQALSQSEERMRLVLDATNDGIWDWNIQAKETYLSPRWKEILGYQENDLSNHESEFFNLVHPEDKDRLSEALTNHFESHAPFRLEIRLRHKDGDYRWILSRGEASCDSNGQPVRMLGSITDITERKLNEAELAYYNDQLEEQVQQRTIELHEQYQRNELILSSTNDGFFAANQSGQIVDANPAFCKLLGYSFTELLELSIVDVEANESPEEVAAHINKVITTGHDRFDSRHRCKDGHIVDVEISVNLVDVGNEKLFYAFVRDISERKLNEQRLIATRNEADRANAAKSEFLSRMSHELRTPLNAIIGFGQLLNTDTVYPLNEFQASNLDEILTASDHLLDLVNEVLDLSRIESGRLEIKLKPVNITPLIESCMAQLQPLAATHNIETALDIKDDYIIMADRMRLNEVLLNLINNAIKFNRDNGHVQINCTPIDNNHLRISIRDTGRGITESALPRLFKPFERLESAYDGIEGSGIGLALVKKLVEAMHGNIGVQSIVGEGSTFWFELPLATELKAGIKPKTNQIAEANLNSKQLKVLYIEDNLSNTRLMQTILASRNDIELLNALNAEDGLKIATQQHPDLILLDINLPGMDGFAALHQLQSDSSTRNIPVIAVTANAMTGDYERAMDAGFIAYLTKPIDVNSFLKMLEDTLPINSKYTP